MLIVVWPSSVSTKAEVWRVLDLAGITNSVRESRNFMKAGFVYVDGNSVRSLKDQIELGRPYWIELRFPNGIVKRTQVFLVTPTRGQPRLNQPDTEYRKP